jgi:glucose-1-phosphate adenylyltransferase
LDLDQLQIKFVTQHIPSTRAKPWGTADAVFQALEQFPDLKKEYFSVCNSDNLYSVKAFQNIKEIEGGGALIAYDMDFLKFNKKKISGFALLVFDLNFNLQEIIEKPDPDDFKNYSDSKGSLYVSMNLFTFSGDQFYSFLKECPVHPTRNEKELPSAILNMVHASPGSFIGIPMQEHVPDLTNKEDILHFENHLKDLDF